jgi:hypothetical protein
MHSERRKVTNAKIAYQAVKYAHMASPKSASGKAILSAAKRLANKARKGAGNHTKIVPAAMKYHNALKRNNKHADAKKILGGASNVKINSAPRP